MVEKLVGSTRYWWNLFLDLRAFQEDLLSREDVSEDFDEGK